MNPSAKNLRKKYVYESDMHKIYNIIVGQRNEQLQEKAASDDTFQVVNTDWDPITYLIIPKKLFSSNQYYQQPIRSFFLATRRLYNTMQYANKNTTEYLVRLRNAQKVNTACNGSPITSILQEHRINIIFPLKTTGFDLLQENDNKESETAGEKMTCAILYLENSDKSRFDDLKKHVKNDYVLNKAE